VLQSIVDKIDSFDSVDHGSQYASSWNENRQCRAVRWWSTTTVSCTHKWHNALSEHPWR